MIIDFHTHSFPDKIAEKAMKSLSAASHSMAFADGTVQGIINSMAEGGISRSVILPVATKAASVAGMNDYACRFNQQYEKQGLFSFGCMHPDFEDWKAELDRVAHMGLKGIKIHPVYQGVNQDDVRFVRILERAGELGLVVVSHAGLDIGFPGEVKSTPAMISNAIRQAGPVKFVAAHMGSWKLWDEVDCLAEYKNIYIDTAFSLGSIIPRENDDYYLGTDTKMLGDKRFCDIVRLFGADRVLFGSDSPWDSQKQAVERIKQSGITQQEADKIFWHNGCRLLGMTI
ncbi:MAG: amidohydrolase [Oscillospiraceae bacterium]|nr:amidohydrolase [Oscillospiraceae bacterium]